MPRKWAMVLKQELRRTFLAAMKRARLIKNEKAYVSIKNIYIFCVFSTKYGKEDHEGRGYLYHPPTSNAR